MRLKWTRRNWCTASIDGMLRTLDPHSSFLDPRAFAQMRERQEGVYYGIGISIVVVDDDITVTILFEGRRRIAPAFGAATSSRSSKERAPRAGPTDMVVKELRGAEGHDGGHLDPPPATRTDSD